MVSVMNIKQLMYGISEDKFFGDNFDIELDDTSDNEFTVSSRSDIDLLLGCSVVITIKSHSLDQVSVKFGNDYGDHMNLVYATKVFDMSKFVYWLKCSLMDYLFKRQINNRQSVIYYN